MPGTQQILAIYNYLQNQVPPSSPPRRLADEKSEVWRMGNLHKVSKEVSCSRGLVMESLNPDPIPAFYWASPRSRSLEGSRFPEEQWNGDSRQECHLQLVGPSASLKITLPAPPPTASHHPLHSGDIYEFSLWLDLCKMLFLTPAAPLCSQILCIFISVLSQCFIHVINYLFPCLSLPADREPVGSRHQT